MVITGNELIDSPGTPIYALCQFYRAFNQKDFSLMQKNWSTEQDSAMSNPLGGIKRGWDEISQVYERIFNGPAKVYVEFYDFQIVDSGQMFFVTGRERGYFQLSDQKIRLAIRTSRVFQKQANQWKQIHHHGSIEDAELLARYQAAVMK